MKGAVLLVVLMLAACSQTAPVTARPSLTPPSPSPASTPAPSDLPLAAVSFSCRLAILTTDGQGAFVSLPAGTVSLDPNGRGLLGNGGTYYDRAFSRWLPVQRQAVSPNGAQYAYQEYKVPGTPGRARLHVVDVPTGKDKLYELGPSGESYVIVDFAGVGIWLSYAGYESPRSGLFLLDLGTGALNDGGRPGILDPVAGGIGVFWFTDGGPNPQMSAGMGSVIPARVLRLTISDGKTETWFTKPGSYLRVLGADLAGHPIIGAYDEVVWLASSPTEAKVIGLPKGYYQSIADSHGIWFGSQQGVYLYSDAGKLQKVSNQPGYPAQGCF